MSSLTVVYGLRLNEKPRFHLDFFRLIYAVVKREHGKVLLLFRANAIKEICIFLQIDRIDN